MLRMLELANGEFKTNMINMLKAVMVKRDSIQEQMSNVSKEGNPKKSKREMLEIKNAITQMKNPFNGLVSRFDMTEEGTSDLEDISI